MTKLIDLQKIIIVGDRVLIRPEEDLQKTNSGLYLPPGVTEKEKVQGGYILKVGPGYPLGLPPDRSETWKEESAAQYIPLQAKEGDFAFFLKKDAVEIEFDKEKMFVVQHSAILLLYRDEELFN